MFGHLQNDRLASQATGGANETRSEREWKNDPRIVGNDQKAQSVEKDRS